MTEPMAPPGNKWGPLEKFLYWARTFESSLSSSPRPWIYMRPLSDVDLASARRKAPREVEGLPNRRLGGVLDA